MLKPFISYVLLLLATLAPTISFALELPIPVRLKSLINNRCASGFKLSHSSKIITASHFVKSVCNPFKCPQIEVVGDNFRKVNELTIRRDLASFDLSLLEGKNLEDLAKPKEVELSSQLTLYSYPNCKDLIVKKGEQIPHNEPGFLATSIIGDYGSSGGVFVQNGEVIGVALHFKSIFSSALGGANHKALQLLLEDDEAVSHHQEAELLTQTLNDYVVPTHGLLRVRRGLNFRSQVEDFLYRSRGEAFFPLFSLPPYYQLQKILAKRPLDSLSALQLTLALGASFEKFGPSSGFLQVLPKKSFSAVINLMVNHPVYKEQLLNFIERAFVAKYLGSELTESAWLLVIIALLTLWGLSVGYVFGFLREEFIVKRIWITFLVGVPFWPLSFVIFLLKRKKFCHTKRLSKT
jgi:hypothetical protein